MEYNFAAMTDNTPQELSERELEILALLATGATNKEIAQSLYISPNTVKVHLRNIFGKIGVSSRTEAAMHAVKLGMVTPTNAAPPQAPVSIPQETPLPKETQAPLTESTETPAARGIPQQTTRRNWLALSGWLLTLLLLITFGAVTLANRTPEANPTEDQFIPGAAQIDMQRWQTHANLLTPRQNFALIAYGGQIYALGGQNNQTTLATAETYLPQQDEWQSIAALPIPVSHTQAAVLNGSIYLPGGLLPSAQPTTTLQVYTPAENIWHTAQPLPYAISDYALTAFEGKLYLFGGTDGQKPLKLALRYTPEDGWQSLPNMPTARAGAYAVNVSNRIYIIGGQSSTDAAPTIQIFNPNDPETPWQTALPLPAADGNLIGAAALADMVYIFNQVPGSNSLQISLYTPQNARWQITTETADTTLSGTLAALGTQVYFCGGSQTMSYQAIFSIAIPIIRK
ncbi:MAG: kelch repeat-containing protein [Anaerolineales bacterium]